MKIVFFGTAEFAIPSLQEILGTAHKVLALVTQPDRKKGRRQVISEPPTKALARKNNIPILQPEDISKPDAIESLEKLNADLFVVVSFGQILTQEALSIPKLYSINLHGSLLPKYRGAAPTNWAIINGETLTGVTVIKMNEHMDAGDIILKKALEIKDDDTNITLTQNLSQLGAKILMEAMELITAGNVVFVKQDEKDATYAPKLKKKDGFIEWEEPALEIHNKVRGLLPWPGAYTYYEGKILKLWKTDLVESQDTGGMGMDAGEVVNVIKNKGIVVRTGLGDIAIRELQVEGKRMLDADSFVRGHRIVKGYRFGKNLDREKS